MSQYELRLSSNLDVFYFPVLPEKLELQKKGKGKVYDIVGLGEINAIQSRELAQISFESVLPAVDYPFISEQARAHNPALLKPQWYVDKINSWMERKRPVRLIFTGGSFPINLAVSIEQFDRWEEAGTSGSIGFTLTLQEYVFYEAKRVTTIQVDGQTKLTEGESQRPDERELPATYTLKAGDTLIKVARQVLGSDARWRELQQLNGLTDAQLKRLPVGHVLKLPAR
ncbi:LysM peptidoglycan-binding domain-containing protein [Paenibacillus sp. 1P07SE]|uniref:LysM peptidoglycan-binding domain-containing protein n=1 Tax=Paenibacillus sp. 1P07SE TaxID=3132209 RepID=UPI0039A4113F